MVLESMLRMILPYWLISMTSDFSVPKQMPLLLTLEAYTRVSCGSASK